MICGEEVMVVSEVMKTWNGHVMGSFAHTLYLLVALAISVDVL